MTRQPSIFTKEVMASIRLLASMGKTGREIAIAINCDEGSLRATCSRAGIQIGYGRKENDLSIKIMITADMADDLRREAKIRGLASDELAAEIIDAVVGDKLFSAVLDK